MSDILHMAGICVTLASTWEVQREAETERDRETDKERDRGRKRFTLPM